MSTPADPLPPPDGIQVWRNAKNRFVVARVHYTADAEKRTPEWRARAKAGMPERGWRREYEISFDTPEGEPVFPEFDPARMVRPLQVNPAARLLRFWDFGHVCPCVTFHQLDVWGRLLGLRELVLWGSSLDQQIEAVKAMTVELMGKPVDCFDAGDPAGEAMTDLGQVTSELAKAGILLHTMRSREGSYQALRQRFLRAVQVPGEGPSAAYLVDPVGCPHLVRALSGGFHKSPRPPYKPVDAHPAKDLCDTVRYGNDNLLGATSDHVAAMREMARADWAWR